MSPEEIHARYFGFGSLAFQSEICVCILWDTVTYLITYHNADGGLAKPSINLGVDGYLHYIILCGYHQLLNSMGTQLLNFVQEAHFISVVKDTFSLP